MGLWYVIANYDLKEYLQPNCKLGEMPGNAALWELFISLKTGRWKYHTVCFIPDIEGDGYYDDWTKIPVPEEDDDLSNV